MIVLVAGGTLFDILHKKSAKYFFNNWGSAKSKGTRKVGGGEMASLAIQTAVVDVLASGEFCNVQRRIAHLLTMYGFLAYVITTAVMVFCVPDARDADARHPAATVEPRGADDLPRRLLVLVLHSGRRRRRGQFTVSPRARRPVHPFASGERDAGSDLGVSAGDGTAPGQTCSSVCTSSPRRCCSRPFRGPSSRICSSSPRQPSRSGSAEANGSRRNLPSPADKPATFGSARRQPRHY